MKNKNYNNTFIYSLLQLTDRSSCKLNREQRDTTTKLKQICYAFCEPTLFSYRQSEVLQVNQKHKTRNRLTINSELDIYKNEDDNTLQDIGLEEFGNLHNNIQVEECELWQTTPIISENK